MLEPRDRSAWKPTPSAPSSAIHSQTLSRVVSLLRGMTGLAGLMSLAVLLAEFILPATYRPSFIIGSFHGRVEAADAEAKKTAVTELARRNAEAASQPPAFVGMEAEGFRQQEQVLADALASKSAIANTADLACVGGALIPHNDRDWGWLGSILSGGCGLGDRVRSDMMNTLRRGGQENSILIQRPRPQAPGLD